MRLAATVMSSQSDKQVPRLQPDNEVIPAVTSSGILQLGTAVSAIGDERQFM
jgi:hypothetical protein